MGHGADHAQRSDRRFAEAATETTFEKLVYNFYNFDKQVPEDPTRVDHQDML